MKRAALRTAAGVCLALLAGRVLNAADPETGRAPAGFRAKGGTTPESYTRTGWAREIVHVRTGMELVFIPAGEYVMGELMSPEEVAREYGGHASWFRGEQPVHLVKITKPFYIGRYEVRVREFRQFTSVTGYQTEVERRNASRNRTDETWRDRKNAMTDRYPVTCVSWDDAAAFSKWAGDGLRLPTEAEWERACRAGTTTEFSFGDDAKELGKYGWYAENAFERTHAGGGKLPNPWRVYDMHGNVWEWCSDWYDDSYYSRSDAEDPQGPASGRGHVERGGSWESPASFCRSATRRGGSSDNTYKANGFRMVVGLDGD